MLGLRRLYIWLPNLRHNLWGKTNPVQVFPINKVIVFNQLTPFYKSWIILINISKGENKLASTFDAG